MTDPTEPDADWLRDQMDAKQADRQHHARQRLFPEPAEPPASQSYPGTERERDAAARLLHTAEAETAQRQADDDVLGLHFRYPMPPR